MKALLLTTTIILASSVALADGFRCLSVDGSVKASVFNYTQAENGIRTGAVMVVSDPSVNAGNKTIASFFESDGLLESHGTSYAAKVDLRYKNSARKGENIGGTKLGQLAYIHLDIDHNYLQPIADGEMTTAEMLLEKRNGVFIAHDLICTRYLKN